MLFFRNNNPFKEGISYFLRDVEMKLDKKDFQILRILEKNCKTTSKEISEIIDSPITTLYSRTKKMEKTGIIKGYKAILNHEKLGKGTTAIVLLEFYFYPTDGVVKRAQIRSKIYKKLVSMKETQCVYKISGKWNLMLKIKVKDIKEVGDFVLNQLKMIEGIEETYTLMVLETKKETLDIL